jgi:hypothetical protein
MKIQARHYWWSLAVGVVIGLALVALAQLGLISLGVVLVGSVALLAICLLGMRFPRFAMWVIGGRQSAQPPKGNADA